MKKFKWLLGILLLALVPILQSCDDDDDYYSIGDSVGTGRPYVQPVAAVISWRVTVGESLIRSALPFLGTDR